MFYFTYILKSLFNGSYYIGSCKNLSNRLKMHNSGRVSSTKRYKPWFVVYREKYANLKEARARELQIKKWKKRALIENLIRTFQNLK